jgi:hypothetical protein
MKHREISHLLFFAEEEKEARSSTKDNFRVEYVFFFKNRIKFSMPFEEERKKEIFWLSGGFLLNRMRTHNKHPCESSGRQFPEFFFVLLLTTAIILKCFS